MAREHPDLPTQPGPARADLAQFTAMLTAKTDAELIVIYRTCNSRSFQDAVLRELEQRRRNGQQ